MRKKIDEVENARGNSLAGEETAKSPLEVVRFRRRGDFLVANGRLLPELGDLRLEQVALVGV